MISEQKNQNKKMNAFLSIYEFKIAGIIPAYHTEIAIGPDWSYKLDLNKPVEITDVTIVLEDKIHLDNSQSYPELAGILSLWL